MVNIGACTESPAGIPFPKTQATVRACAEAASCQKMDDDILVIVARATLAPPKIIQHCDDEIVHVQSGELHAPGNCTPGRNCMPSETEYRPPVDKNLRSEDANLLRADDATKQAVDNGASGKANGLHKIVVDVCQISSSVHERTGMH